MIKRNISKIIIAVILAFAVTSYFLLTNKKQDVQSGGLSHFRVEAFEKETGWGYRVYQDNTPLIEQQYIPGEAGQLGFRSEELALKTGNFVKEKLVKGIFPPSISSEELDSLQVR